MVRFLGGASPKRAKTERTQELGARIKQASQPRDETGPSGENMGSDTTVGRIRVGKTRVIDASGHKCLAE